MNQSLTDYADAYTLALEIDWKYEGRIWYLGVNVEHILGEGYVVFIKVAPGFSYNCKDQPKRVNGVQVRVVERSITPPPMNVEPL